MTDKKHDVSAAGTPIIKDAYDGRPRQRFEVTIDGSIIAGTQFQGSDGTKNLWLELDPKGRPNEIKIELKKGSDIINVFSYGANGGEGAGNQFKDHSLAQRIKSTWDAAKKLKPGETKPVIDEGESRALASLVVEAGNEAGFQVPHKAKSTTKAI